ncbi:STE3-like pheromone receptor [Mycena sanguinolenta]|uniref:STE3-like pheromone receptor n=1 Tax=Mycena sanguinolenta TaxID=230812 RepID=A0A8H6Z8G7_9AGAR|nr:STE3-like pheromone receptor [Mycena sanguinolenta]
MSAPTDPFYPAFQILSFLGFVLVLIPLPWHFQAWNSGTCLFMIWTALSCLIAFVNSVVWANSVDDVAPVWCDISTRLMVGIAVAIPASSLCINRRLYKIASCQTVSVTQAEKRRAVLVDLAIGLGIPLLQMPLQFIVQGHRFNIVENIGCYPTTYNVAIAYPLSYLWPNIINIISGCYAICTLRAFLHRRAQFSQFLSLNSGLTATRYFRLMALASMELFLSLPIFTYGLYLTITRQPIQPWISWDNVHADFSNIGQEPAIIWRSDSHFQATYELSRWIGVVCALVFFGFFGFAAEAKKQYRLAFWAVAKLCGCTPPANGALPLPRISFPWTKTKAANSLPISVPLTPIKKHPDSLFGDSRTESEIDGHSQSSMEKGHGCEYILPSPVIKRCIRSAAVRARNRSRSVRGIPFAVFIHGVRW